MHSPLSKREDTSCDNRELQFTQFPLESTLAAATATTTQAQQRTSTATPNQNLHMITSNDQSTKGTFSSENNHHMVPQNIQQNINLNTNGISTVVIENRFHSYVQNYRSNPVQQHDERTPEMHMSGPKGLPNQVNTQDIPPNNMISFQSNNFVKQQQQQQPYACDASSSQHFEVQGIIQQGNDIITLPSFAGDLSKYQVDTCEGSQGKQGKTNACSDLEYHSKLEEEIRELKRKFKDVSSENECLERALQELQARYDGVQKEHAREIAQLKINMFNSVVESDRAFGGNNKDEDASIAFSREFDQPNATVGSSTGFVYDSKHQLHRGIASTAPNQGIERDLVHSIEIIEDDPLQNHRHLALLNRRRNQFDFQDEDFIEFKQHQTPNNNDKRMQVQQQIEENSNVETLIRRNKEEFQLKTSATNDQQQHTFVGEIVNVQPWEDDRKQQHQQQQQHLSVPQSTSKQTNNMNNNAVRLQSNKKVSAVQVFEATEQQLTNLRSENKLLLQQVASLQNEIAFITQMSSEARERQEMLNNAIGNVRSAHMREISEWQGKFDSIQSEMKKITSVNKTLQNEVIRAKEENGQHNRTSTMLDEKTLENLFDSDFDSEDADEDLEDDGYGDKDSKNIRRHRNEILGSMAHNEKVYNNIIYLKSKNKKLHAQLQDWKRQYWLLEKSSHHQPQNQQLHSELNNKQPNSYNHVQEEQHSVSLFQQDHATSSSSSNQLQKESQIYQQQHSYIQQQQQQQKQQHHNQQQRSQQQKQENSMPSMLEINFSKYFTSSTPVLQLSPKISQPLARDSSEVSILPDTRGGIGLQQQQNKNATNVNYSQLNVRLSDATDEVPEDTSRFLNSNIYDNHTQTSQNRIDSTSALGYQSEMPSYSYKNSPDSNAASAPPVSATVVVTKSSHQFQNAKNITFLDEDSSRQMMMLASQEFPSRVNNNNNNNNNQSPIRKADEIMKNRQEMNVNSTTLKELRQQVSQLQDKRSKQQLTGVSHHGMATGQQAFSPKSNTLLANSKSYASNFSMHFKQSPSPISHDAIAANKKGPFSNRHSDFMRNKMTTPTSARGEKLINLQVAQTLISARSPKEKNSSLRQNYTNFIFYGHNKKNNNNNMNANCADQSIGSPKNSTHVLNQSVSAISHGAATLKAKSARELKQVTPPTLTNQQMTGNYYLYVQHTQKGIDALRQNNDETIRGDGKVFNVLQPSMHLNQSQSHSQLLLNNSSQPILKQGGSPAQFQTLKASPSNYPKQIETSFTNNLIYSKNKFTQRIKDKFS